MKLILLALILAASADAKPAFIDRHAMQENEWRFSHLFHRSASAIACSTLPPDDALIQKMVTLDKKCVQEINIPSCTELCKIKWPDSARFENDLYDATRDQKLPDVTDVCSPGGKYEILSATLNALHCDQDKKNFASLPELTAIFEKIRKVWPYHMKDAGRLCHERAFLLSDYLFQSGYRSQLIDMTGSSQSFQKYLHGQAFAFVNHWAVQVETASGEVYLLDPQFMDTPLKRDDYLRSLTEKKAPVKELGFMERSSREVQDKNTTVYRTYHPLTVDEDEHGDPVTPEMASTAGCEKMRLLKKTLVQAQIAKSEGAP